MDVIRVEMGGRTWTFPADARGARLAGRSLIDAADDQAEDDDDERAARGDRPAPLVEALDRLIERRTHAPLAQG